jgi:lysophospholipase L1-like esterase
MSVDRGRPRRLGGAAVARRVLFCAVVTGFCGGPGSLRTEATTPTEAPARGAPGGGRWIASWTAAAQLTEPHDLPPAPGLAHRTLAQSLLLSVGGSSLRVHVSNEYGRSALVLRSATIAAGGPHGVPAAGDSRPASFGGEAAITIGAGDVVVSDPVPIEVAAGTNLTISLSLGEIPREVTGHPGSRTTSTISPRRSAGDGGDPGTRAVGTQVDHWYFLTRIDVKADPSARALVILGDSIADGRGSTTNANDRWPDELSRRLSARAGGRPIAVLNQGLGGNRVLAGGLGPPILERYRRDALDLEQVRYLLLSAGINDLGALGEPGGEAIEGSVAAALIAAYEEIISAAHARSILVYAGTVLPFEGSVYFSDEGEAERQRFNAWIRATSRLDGVVDFDRITRDPRRPARLSPEVDGGDGLHPSPRGYAIMGNAVSLALFER